LLTSTLFAYTTLFRSNFLILFRGGGTAAEFRRFAGMLMGVVAGTVIGAQLLHRLDPGLVSLIVGMTALFVAGSGLLNRTPEFSTGVGQVAGPVVGLAAGVMGGITGIFAPLIVAFVRALKVDKRRG